MNHQHQSISRSNYSGRNGLSNRENTINSTISHTGVNPHSKYL